MSHDAARYEAEFEEQARRRGEEISAGEAGVQQAAAMDEDRSPGAEIAEVQRSGRHHDSSDTGPCHQQPGPGDRRRRGGPRR